MEHKGNTEDLHQKFDAMRQQVEQLEQALQIQKQIAYVSGIFQRDVTVRTLLESIAEGVIVCDQDGIIVLINKRSEKLFGYRANEVIGRSLNTLLPERHFKAHAEHLHSFFTKPRVRTMGQGMDLTGKRKDGLEIPIEVSLSYLETENGLLGLAFVTDISLRKEAELALKLRNQELDAFAHTVAHDLKASLSTLIGYSEALAETHKALSEVELEDYLTALARNGRQMSNIIDELLVFASIRKEDVIHNPLDMKSIVANTLQRLNYVIKQYKARIVLPDMWHNSTGNALWVEEVWLNYITNALKYGGNPPVIELGSKIEGDYVKYWVKDNGQGIGQELHAKLFESFAKLHMPKTQGYGLGLSIVKSIVEKLNGMVKVESEVGQGSKFCFYLRRSL